MKEFKTRHPTGARSPAGRAGYYAPKAHATQWAPNGRFRPETRETAQELLVGRRCDKSRSAAQRGRSPSS